MKKSNLWSRMSRSCLVLTLAASLALACGGTTRSSDVRPEPVRVDVPPALQGASADLPDVIERAMPSVVSVASTKIAQTHSPFQWFFGGGPREQRQEGLGSGVIISENGIVVTNNHVVAEADEIKVVTIDKREFDAKVLGTDPKSDLAVLRLEGDVSGLRPLPFGDSSELRLGETVIAIGNPFGVGQTVTAGIVSAKGRANVGIVDYEDFIQTDAAINPGNSGGALVNARGELVGINTAILSRSGGYMGIGFAIPSNMARPIVGSLEKDGRVARGWLGVALQPIDRDIARAMKLDGTHGVLIADVQQGSPASRGGLQRGDVVTHLDDTEIDSTGRFRNLVASAGVGTTVKLAVLREGKKKALKVKLGEAPSDEGPVATPSKKGDAEQLDGMQLGQLTPERRQQLGVSDDVHAGVLVQGVEPGSPAARAGIRPGDLVLEVNRRPVKTVAEARKVYERAKGTRLLLVHRQGATFFVVIKS